MRHGTSLETARGRSRSTGSGWRDRLSGTSAPLAVVGTTDRRGTEVHFMGATQTFGRIEYHYDILAKRIRELSFLNNGTKIELLEPLGENSPGSTVAHRGSTSSRSSR